MRELSGFWGLDDLLTRDEEFIVKHHVINVHIGSHLNSTSNIKYLQMLSTGSFTSDLNLVNFYFTTGL